MEYTADYLIEFLRKLYCDSNEEEHKFFPGLSQNVKDVGMVLEDICGRSAYLAQPTGRIECYRFSMPCFERLPSDRYSLRYEHVRVVGRASYFEILVSSVLPVIECSYYVYSIRDELMHYEISDLYAYDWKEAHSEWTLSSDKLKESVEKIGLKILPHAVTGMPIGPEFPDELTYKQNDRQIRDILFLNGPG
ncbi:MAG: hypothetical protein NXI24_23540 [bacterium]|nr:hypothetical protein [bacterium]